MAHSEDLWFQQGASALQWSEFSATVCAPGGNAVFSVASSREEQFVGEVPVSDLMVVNTTITVDLRQYREQGQDPGPVWGRLRFNVTPPESTQEALRTVSLWALFAGTNYCGNTQYLHGAEADARLALRVVPRYFMQDPHKLVHPHIVTGIAATCTAITERLTNMAASAQRGDVVLFFFSGLGTTVVEPRSSTDGQSIDFISLTALCPSDAQLTPDEKFNQVRNVLTSERVGQLLDPALDKGATVVLVLDCGFTGPAKDAPTPIVGPSDNPPQYGTDRRHKFRPTQQREDPVAYDFRNVVLYLNGCSRDLPAPRSAGAGLRESVSVGSVLDTLRVGARQDGSQRWADIARGAQGFAAGIVEAAKRASATRDAAHDREAQEALEAMSAEQWAAVAARAVERDPQAMRLVVDSVAGGLHASPERREQLLRTLSDNAAVSALAEAPAATQRGWGEREPSLVAGAGGGQEGVRRGLRELPYQRKLELLGDKESAQPWVGVVAQMLTQAPEATRAALSAEVAGQATPASCFRDMLLAISSRNAEKVIAMIGEASGKDPTAGQLAQAVIGGCAVVPAVASRLRGEGAMCAGCGAAGGVQSIGIGDLRTIVCCGMEDILEGVAAAQPAAVHNAVLGALSHCSDQSSQWPPHYAFSGEPGAEGASGIQWTTTRDVCNVALATALFRDSQMWNASSRREFAEAAKSLLPHVELEDLSVFDAEHVLSLLPDAKLSNMLLWPGPQQDREAEAAMGPVLRGMRSAWLEVLSAAAGSEDSPTGGRAAVVRLWAKRGTTVEEEAANYHQRMHEATQRTLCRAVDDVEQREGARVRDRVRGFLGASGTDDQAISSGTASLTRLGWLELLRAVVVDDAVALQAVGDALGDVVGRRVDTGEISDSEGEGLAELVREASDSGYSRVVAALAQTEYTRGALEAVGASMRGLLDIIRAGVKQLPNVLVPLISAASGREISAEAVIDWADRAATGSDGASVSLRAWPEPTVYPSGRGMAILVVPSENWTRAMRGVARGGSAPARGEGAVLATWDSPVSLRAVLHDSAVAGELSDPQIAVVPRATGRAEAIRALWQPAAGDPGDVDSAHAFAAVRAVVEAVERVLRPMRAGDWPRQALPQLCDGVGGPAGAGSDEGLLWQVGATLRVDAEARGVTEPLYSRAAGGLLLPARGAGAAAGPEAARGGAWEVVAHTAGYAVLDALRPAWAEGVGRRPEGGVLHEAVADLTALLVGLGTPAVGGAVVAQTRCDLRAGVAAGRQQPAVADEALGGSAVRSASSGLTARDVWEAATGRARERARRWGSREVSAMVTSAVVGAVAAEVARRSRRGAGAAAEDPAEVLSQAAHEALRALVAACLSADHRTAAPTLVQFCGLLVADGTPDGEGSEGMDAGLRAALRQELERRYLLPEQWQHVQQKQHELQPLSLPAESIEHTNCGNKEYLRGAEVDALQARDAVTGYFRQDAYKSVHHKTKTGIKATCRALRERLTRMAVSAQRGDVVLFYFSGLGTTVVEPRRSPDGQSTDLIRMTALCPYDAELAPNANGEPRNVLTSELVGQLLDPALNSGATVILILDCCFTGPGNSAPTPIASLRFDALRYGDNRLYKFLPTQQRADLAVRDFVAVVQDLNGTVRDVSAPAPRSAGAGLRESVSVGSVVDTLRVGARQDGSQRWADIARGAQGFAAGIVEAAKRASATRDAAHDREAQEALEAMSAEQWAAVAARAVERDPQAMRLVVDSVAGGLHASPERREQLLRTLSDNAAVSALAEAPAATQRGWGEREPSLVAGAGGGQEGVRRGLRELPYQRKLELLGDKESAQPWVGVVAQMLTQAPEATRAALSAEVAGQATPASCFRDMLLAISSRNAEKVVAMIGEASGSAGVQEPQGSNGGALAEDPMAGQLAQAVIGGCAVVPAVASRLRGEGAMCAGCGAAGGVQSIGIGDLRTIVCCGMEDILEGVAAAQPAAVHNAVLGALSHCSDQSSQWPPHYAFSGEPGAEGASGIQWTTTRDVCNVALATALFRDSQMWNASSRREFAEAAKSLLPHVELEDLSVYDAEHVLSLLPDAKLSNMLLWPGPQQDREAEAAMGPVLRGMRSAWLEVLSAAAGSEDSPTGGRAAVVRLWAKRGTTVEEEAANYHQRMHEATQRTLCRAVDDVEQREGARVRDRVRGFLGASGTDDQAISSGTASLTRLGWLELLRAVVVDDAVALQAVGDALGDVVGRRVDTGEISDSEGEGLAELVREASDSGYSRVVAALAQTEYTRGALEAVGASMRGLLDIIRAGVKQLPNVLVPLISAASGREISAEAVIDWADRAATGSDGASVSLRAWPEPTVYPSGRGMAILVVPSENWTRAMRGVARGGSAPARGEGAVLATWDSPVSLRAVLHDSAVAGELSDPQIAVVPRATRRAEAIRALWQPAAGDPGDVDSAHAFAAVRAVVEAVERVLRPMRAGDWPRQALPQLCDGVGGPAGAGSDEGLLWQVGATLRVDADARGVTEPLYSRAAGGLLLPARGAGAAAGPEAARGGAWEVVAHTAGYAVLDALRPAWAEGVGRRPEGGVLHEAVADLTALLVGLGTPAVGGAVVAQTRCDLRAGVAAGRQQAAVADEALGGSAVRSASSGLTARDVWEAATGRARERARRWGSREVSAMVTSAVFGAVAAEVARRSRRGARAAAEDPAEVLSQAAHEALRALVAACLSADHRTAAPTLVQFCGLLVADGTPDGEGSEDMDAGLRAALHQELERRYLLPEQWQHVQQKQVEIQPLSLPAESIEHTSATQQLPLLRAQFMVDGGSRSAAVAGPARRMCECIAMAGAKTRSCVECPVSSQLWATLSGGAQKALARARSDEVGAWEGLVETWEAVERMAAGQRFGDRRMWSAIVVEAAEERTGEGCREAVKKLVLSLEYVVGCCNESTSLRLWRQVLVSFGNAP
eukprot:m51a1_g10253 hypothetical protein (2926) ;mRNA; f:67741-81340